MKFPEILEQHREYLESTCRPSNEITFLLEETKPWESKLGGNLYLEDVKTYPKGTDGRPMVFFAQINFEEMPPLPDFPTTGILQFFTDFTLDGVCLAKYIPQYTQDETKLIQENPYPREGESSKERGKLTFTYRMMPIDVGSNEFNVTFSHIPSSSKEYESLLVFCNSCGSKVSGYPQFRQDAPAYYKNANMNVVLLQLDFEDVYGNSGEGGTCIFFIAKDALLKRDFSNIVYTYQCW